MTNAMFVLWSVEAWLLALAPAIMAVFAINRGTLLRRINYHVISGSFNTASLLVFGLLSGSLEDVVNFEWVSGDEEMLARSAVFLVFAVASVVSITYQLGEDTLDMCYHVFMVITAQITWVLAAKTTDHSFFWVYQTFSTLGLLAFHMFLESRNSECRNPAYGNFLLSFFSLYFFVYYLFTGLGPWHLGSISLIAQQSVLMVADVAFVVFGMINIAHFGGEALIATNLRMRPGITREKNSNDVQRLKLTLHSK